MEDRRSGKKGFALIRIGKKYGKTGDERMSNAIVTLKKGEGKSG